jgi:hypothetical protein
MVLKVELINVLLKFGKHAGGVVYVDKGFAENEASQMAVVVKNEVLEFVPGFFQELTEVFDNYAIHLTLVWVESPLWARSAGPSPQGIGYFSPTGDSTSTDHTWI